MLAAPLVTAALAAARALTCDYLVGVAGFEPAASSSRTERAHVRWRAQAMIRPAMTTMLDPEAEVVSAPVRHDEPRFVRRDDGLGTVTQPELAQHATDVGLHGLFGDHEAVRNLDV
jgi:hypothetical protein